MKIPQKQWEESIPGEQENGVQLLNNGVYQNQPQNSGLQEVKKLEHSNSNNTPPTTDPIRTVENQSVFKTTDKKLSNSEGMQQEDLIKNLTIAVRKQRGKSGFQDEQLDYSDEDDHQEDSLFCLEEESFTEQKKTVNQEKKNYTKLVEGLNRMSSMIPPSESPSNS